MSQQGENFIRQGDSAFVIRGKLIMDGGTMVPSSESQASDITDLSVTGTYATDDTPIETAINEIIAVLRSNGLIAS